MRTTAITIAVTAAINIGCAPAGHTDPSKFPDINAYTPVNPQDYTIELPNPGRPYAARVIRFLTPDGVTCAVGDEGAGCTGNNFPGVLPVANDPSRGLVGVNEIGTTSGLRQTNSPYTMDPNHPFKTLPPFHSITFNGVTCGVDDAKMTACKDPQGRGFVLSPNGSGWLPHV